MTDLITINGRFLEQRITGVQRFALEVTRALARIRPVRVLAPQGADASLLPEVDVRFVGRSSGHIWEQFTLPRQLRSVGSPLLLNLASTAPATYSNQIATHHDITYVRHPQSFSRRFRVVYAALIPPILRNSKLVITVSNFSRDEISSHYGVDPGKFIIVPNAASSIFTPIGPRREPSDYLLAVSSPNRHKNFAALATAFEAAHTSTIARLLIVGAASDAFARTKTTMSSRVKYLGSVSDEELAELYRGAVAFAFPSLYEGFGIPPVEAQQAGVPVIAARSASIPEVLGDSALYFDPTEIADIQGAIEGVDASEELRGRLKALGLQNAAQYSWERSAKVLSEAIEDLG